MGTFATSVILELVALLTRFADAPIQSERENQERLHQHLSHVRERFGHGSADAAQSGSDEAPAVEEDPIP